MSADHSLPRGARRATLADAIKTFKAINEIAGQYGYITGLLGSTLTKGSGIDIDFLLAPSVDTKRSAHEVGTAIVRERAKRVFAYEELDEHGQDVAFTFLQADKTFIDCYIVGLPEED